MNSRSLGTLCLKLAAPCLALALALLAPSQAFASDFHDFGGTNDGKNPYSGLVFDSNGNLYGTTLNGGTHTDGTVFEISSGGTYSVIFNFAGGTGDGSHPYAGLIVDGSGNLYGTTSGGGAHSLGTVFELSPPVPPSTSWTETLLHSFASTGDGNTPYGGLALDSSGNLWGTTSEGGTSSFGIVFEIASGGMYSVNHNFSGGTDGRTPYGSLIVDSAGTTVYGTTTRGGSATNCSLGCGTVFKVASGTYSNYYDFGGSTTDGADPLYGVMVFDSTGNLYGMTNGGGSSNDGVVFKITSLGVESVVHNFSAATTDGKQPEGGLSIDSSGDLYGTTFSGGANNLGTIFEINSMGTFSLVYSFSGGTSDGSSPVSSNGVAIDSSGKLWGTTLDAGANSDGIVFKQ